FTPFWLKTAGTPMAKPLSPYSPSSTQDTVKARWLPLKIWRQISTIVPPMPYSVHPFW
ncbi:hypothetical protein NT04LM_2327, partial [Listeria monocytogenes FSL F2-208]